MTTGSANDHELNDGAPDLGVNDFSAFVGRLQEELVPELTDGDARWDFSRTLPMTERTWKIISEATRAASLGNRRLSAAEVAGFALEKAFAGWEFPDEIDSKSTEEQDESLLGCIMYDEFERVALEAGHNYRSPGKAWRTAINETTIRMYDPETLKKPAQQFEMEAELTAAGVEIYDTPLDMLPSYMRDRYGEPHWRNRGLVRTAFAIKDPKLGWIQTCKAIDTRLIAVSFGSRPDAIMVSKTNFGLSTKGLESFVRNAALLKGMQMSGFGPVIIGLYHDILEIHSPSE